MMTDTKYFVDVNGTIQATDSAPAGFHFQFVEYRTHQEVWVVNNETYEVQDEYVLWDSLEELTTAIERVYNGNQTK